MKRIILTGFAGCFKTSAGKTVAKKLNLPFFDTDSIILKMQNQSISEIFAEKGEQFFRALENSVLADLPTEDAVISLGGGSLLCPNAENLKQNSVVVWLTATPKTIFERISQNPSRPLYFKKSLEEISAALSKRQKSYENFSDIKIPTDHQTSDDTANQILQSLAKI